MKNSPLFGANAVFIEELYRQFLENPQSVDASWHSFFSDFGKIAPKAAVTEAPWKSCQHKIVGHNNPTPSLTAPSAITDDGIINRSLAAVQLVSAYRQFGHTAIQYDPLGLQPASPATELSPEHYGLSNESLNDPIIMNGILGLDKARLGDAVSMLQKVYANRIGAEFCHIENAAERQWLQEYLEQSGGNFGINNNESKEALFDLATAEMFEEFLHKKFPGAKRFSIEGGEAMIAALNIMINQHAHHNGKEVVLGMAHRGRLNVLTRVMGKTYRSMFAEFAGGSCFPAELKIPGDVKYHMGLSTDKVINGKTVHLSLLPNPSHLELVNAVALGKARAKQDMTGDTTRSEILTILIHGDAAFSGQGSVPESLSLSQLKAYQTGGTVHVIINNQVGFTTNPTDCRSSRYCTDVAKIIAAPILHVSGDDIEANLFVSKLAIDYRAKFNKDIVVDIICYRKHGHNEGDEPMFTQPNMYKVIAQHESPRRSYAKRLLAEGIISDADYQSYQATVQKHLEDELAQSQTYLPAKADWLEGVWSGMKASTPEGISTQPKTGVSVATLKKLANLISEVPAGFNLNSKIARQLQSRKETIKTDTAFEWGTGEALAMATLLQEGYNIRMSGQDAQRGTFSHRHAVVVDQENEARYCPLNNIDAPGKLEIYNSNLSELAVMGFEYGYSITNPKTLTIWEAQFGDFANGAQMMVDQYVAPGEVKWLRMSGLVLLLPHGYEGQGPEHSSARLERYLELCAMDNIQVLNCSTPASLFHALRRQMHRNFRKPLVIMSPKSLLRKPLSTLADMQEGTSFMPVITDTTLTGNKVNKLILCSGKVYYDLLEKREELGIKDVALIRLEQLYPFPQTELSALLKKHPDATITWCQEEHKNMGAYNFVYHKLKAVMKQINHQNQDITYAGREESASPSTGYMKTHLAQQNDFLQAVFK